MHHMHIWNEINDVLFWILLFVMAWLAYILAFHGGVPNIGTAPAIQKKAANILKDHATKRGGDFTIVDMGSGEGGFTRLIARNVPFAHVIGLEMSPQSYQLAQLGKRLKKIGNIEYKLGDMF